MRGGRGWEGGNMGRSEEWVEEGGRHIYIYIY